LLAARQPANAAQRTACLRRYRRMEQPADITELSERLKPFAGKIAAWRDRALEINELADQVVASKTVDPETLVEVEQTGTDIRAEIVAFDKLVSEVGEISPASAAQLGSIGDALRLVLLEITELGTRMYAVRWQAVIDTADASHSAAAAGATDAPAEEAAHHVAPDEVIYLGGPSGPDGVDLPAGGGGTKDAAPAAAPSDAKPGVAGIPVPPTPATDANDDKAGINPPENAAPEPRR
jgi:hypothetical protein